MSESHDITNLDLQDRIANNTDFAVATIAERDAIQTWRRKWGMLVVVFADSLPVNNQMYVLRPVNADLGDNSNWSAAESPAWGLAGNAGTNPAAHFIGTTDNQPVVVRVNNVERARFLSTGFDLVGQIRLVQDSLVSIRFDTTSQAWGARNWAVVNSNQTFGDFCIIQSNDLGGDPLVDGTIRQYFDIFGNIGINTLFPEARLDVNGTVIVRDSLKLMAQATDANHAVRADRAISAGAGLSGGGDLTANRSLAVVYGATANSAVQGNVAINIAAGLNMTGGGQLTLGAGGTIPVAVSANPAFDSINLGGIVRNTWPAGAPGGDATQIQYNRAGEFAGALFYYDETASIIYRFDTTEMTGRQTILGVQNGSVTQFSVMSDGTIQTGNDSPAFKIHKFSPTPTGGIIHINIHNTNYTFEVIL